MGELKKIRTKYRQKENDINIYVRNIKNWLKIEKIFLKQFQMLNILKLFRTSWNVIFSFLKLIQNIFEWKNNVFYFYFKRHSFVSKTYLKMYIFNRKISTKIKNQEKLDFPSVVQKVLIFYNRYLGSTNKKQFDFCPCIIFSGFFSIPTNLPKTSNRSINSYQRYRFLIFT